VHHYQPFGACPSCASRRLLVRQGGPRAYRQQRGPAATAGPGASERQAAAPRVRRRGSRIQPRARAPHRARAAGAAAAAPGRRRGAARACALGAYGLVALGRAGRGRGRRGRGGCLWPGRRGRVHGRGQGRARTRGWHRVVGAIVYVLHNLVPTGHARRGRGRRAWVKRWRGRRYGGCPGRRRARWRVCGRGGALLGRQRRRGCGDRSCSAAPREVPCATAHCLTRHAAVHWAGAARESVLIQCHQHQES